MHIVQNIHVGSTTCNWRRSDRETVNSTEISAVAAEMCVCEGLLLLELHRQQELIDRLLSALHTHTHTHLSFPSPFSRFPQTHILALCISSLVLLSVDKGPHHASVSDHLLITQNLIDLYVNIVRSDLTGQRCYLNVCEMYSIHR